MSGVSQGDSVSTVDGDGLVWDSVSTAFPGVSWETGAAFSPEDLFFYGEVGAWYDPSDLTTMFQDRVGMTPVTADGQTVGLILDKSKGLVLGSELVTNGDLSNGTTGWLGTNASLSVVSGELEVNVTTAWGYCRQVISGLFTVGKTYKISGVFRAGSVTTARVQRATWSGVSTTSKTNVPFTWHWLADSTNFTIELDTGGEVGTAYFDNISIKEIAGNHAVAPSDAARPLYKTDGTYHWLQFDGVDDYIKSSAFSSNLTYPITNVLGLMLNSHINNKYIHDGGTVDSMVLYQNGSTGNVSIYAGGSGTGVVGPLSIGTSFVVTEVFNLANSKLGLNQATVNATTGGVNTNAVSFGANATGVASSAAKIYSLIVRGALSTTQEITDTETWVNSKTGAY